MATASSNGEAFDLTPEPRILPMLGEITLAEWRCVAELIDNSIDGFIGAVRTGIPVGEPEVHVSLPTSAMGNPRVTVRDNGPGMAASILEQAVRAGWTGNDPVGSLGLFGMGFNIATARLGTRTHVWTTRDGDSEWHGLQIDFQTLLRQRHFRTPRLTRPKDDRREHGTEVTVEQLKPEAAHWLARTGNRTRVSRELAKVYSSMLRRNGVPTRFRLTLNGVQIQGRQHCVWGDGDTTRVVSTPRHGEVNAFQAVNVDLGHRDFCSACWQWLLSDERVCPTCDSPDHVVSRPRVIHGWIGLQRYLSEDEYGIDFIRHGRKIELTNKDLFYWDNDGLMEREYPIDDPRYRGRIVGEIHLDHARVTYTKDRFDRNDPAWDEMVQALRGEGPLRPEKAEQLGYGLNTSPLSLLFQAFRRSNPQRRVAGGYARLLVVKDNEQATEMARKFYAGEHEYQTDAKWYELVEEADRELLTETPGGVGGGETGDLEGLSGATTTGSAEDDGVAPETETEAPTAPPRVPLTAMTREYVSESTGLRWNVEAFQVSMDDPDLGGPREPWRLLATTRGDYQFLVNQQHPIFQSATMTPLDGLLVQLAWAAVDFLRGQSSSVTFPAVLAELRDRFATTSKLDASALSVQASAALTGIGRSLSRSVENGDGAILFQELSPSEQDAVQHRMAARAIPNPQAAVSEGRFLEYAPPRTILMFFERHPELFLDGRYWETAYSSLDYGTESATEEARSRVVQYFAGLIADTVWLAEQGTSDLAEASRERLLRSALALDLLAPSVEAD